MCKLELEGGELKVIIMWKVPRNRILQVGDRSATLRGGIAINLKRVTEGRKEARGKDKRRGEVRRWWRQTGGRAAGRRRGRMPIWCLHLSVNVMSSIWQQMTRTGRGQVKNLTQGESISPSVHCITPFTLTHHVHLHDFALFPFSHHLYFILFSKTLFLFSKCAYGFSSYGEQFICVCVCHAVMLACMYVPVYVLVIGPQQQPWLQSLARVQSLICLHIGIHSKQADL